MDYEKTIRDIEEMILQVAEMNAAIADIIAFLLIEIRNRDPELTSNIGILLNNLAETDKIDKTDAFATLAKRMFLATSGNHDIFFPSLKKPLQKPLTREELKVRLRVIQGGVQS